MPKNGFKGWLFDVGLHFGICATSKIILQVDTYRIMPRNIGIDYPIYCDTYEEAKQTLIDRIAYMKNELEKFES